MSTRHMIGAFVTLGALLLPARVGAGQADGPFWEESIQTGNDAGGVPTTAETTRGDGQLSRILGNLDGTDDDADGIPDFEDMFLVRICDVNAFLASTAKMEGGLADFDTRLWLFRPTANVAEAVGVVGNDNRPSQPPTLASLINGDPDDGSPPLVQPGLYYLAISGTARDPRSSTGPQGEIFFLGTPTEISGPDGPGGKAPIVGWETIGLPPAIGAYEIALVGVAFGSTPSIDCNQNMRADVCDILLGSSADDNGNNIPDECEDDADLDGDGDVDFADLLVLFSRWGPCSMPPAPCPADLSGNGIVDFADVLILLAVWT